MDEQQGVEDARRQDIGDRAGAGERLAEIAVEDSAQPMGISHHRRVVEVHLLPEDRDRLWRRIAAEHARGDVAGQHLDDRKNGDRNDEQGEHRQQNSRDHQPQDCHWNQPTLAVRSLPSGMIIESLIGTTSLGYSATTPPISGREAPEADRVALQPQPPSRRIGKRDGAVERQGLALEHVRRRQA